MRVFVPRDEIDGDDYGAHLDQVENVR